MRKLLKGVTTVRKNHGGLREKEEWRLARLCKHPLWLTKFCFITWEVSKSCASAWYLQLMKLCMFVGSLMFKNFKPKRPKWFGYFKMKTPLNHKLISKVLGPGNNKARIWALFILRGHSSFPAVNTVISVIRSMDFARKWELMVHVFLLQLNSYLWWF